MTKDLRAHIKLKRLPREYKYVRFASNQEVLHALGVLHAAHPDAEASAFFSPRDPSLLVGSDCAAAGIREEPSWTAFETVGEMPFGTVPGLIASISQCLIREAIGVCVISTYDKDLFLIRTSKAEGACRLLQNDGWGVLI